MTLDWLAPAPRPAGGLHGHIEDTASTSTLVALAVAARSRPDRRVVVCSEHAHSSVDKAARLLELELRKVPVDESSGCDRSCSSSTTPARSSRRSGRPAPRRSIRFQRSPTPARRPASGSTSTRRTRARRPSAPSSATAFAGWERADSIVVNPHKWLGVADGLLGALDPRPEDFRETFSLVPEYLRVADDVVNLSEVSIPLGRRFRALKLWAVLRCLRARGAAGADSRARPAGRAVRGLGARRARLGGRAPRHVLARLLPPARDRTRERGAARASQRVRARSSSPTRGSATATCCGSRSATSARPRTTSARLGRAPARGGGAVKTSALGHVSTRPRAALRHSSATASSGPRVAGVPPEFAALARAGGERVSRRRRPPSVARRSRSETAIRVPAACSAACRVRARAGGRAAARRARVARLPALGRLRLRGGGRRIARLLEGAIRRHSRRRASSIVSTTDRGGGSSSG